MVRPKRNTSKTLDVAQQRAFSLEGEEGDFAIY